jgi:hypothetical protein
LWVTCSFDNLVAIFDLNSGQWSQWFPAPHPANRGRDVHHFNSIRKIGREIGLLAHHFGPSEVLFYDSETLQLNSVAPIGAEAHDILLFGNALATCSSGDGWVVNVSGRRLRTGNFPRGVAIAPEGNLLGISVLSERSQRASQSGILRWYTPDWQFHTDCVLPRVGMVLDLLALGEGEFDCQALESWPDAQFTEGYNHLAPGNRYAPESFVADRGDHTLDWHAPEMRHCWTAAKRATLAILVNPGETSVCIEVGSSFPGPYDAEIWLDESILGVVRFPCPGVQQHAFRLPEGFTGAALLSFRVPHLWRPQDEITGSSDERLLGLAVYGVTVEL